MTAPTARSRGPLLWTAFLLVTLFIAGGISYLASSSPDGLDSTTLRGCEVIGGNGTEELTGHCIAQSAKDHALAGSLLADYAVAGVDGTNGFAGVVGVLATLAVAGGVFWVIARSRARAGSRAADGP